MTADLYDIYRAYAEKETPDGLLDRIREHFVSCGRAFREGLMSDEEFWAATYYDRTMYVDLWEMKDVRVDEKSLNRNRNVTESFAEWKKTGKAERRPWMGQCIGSSRDLDEAVQWFFSVIDACKVPFSEFENIPPEEAKAFPQIYLTWRRGDEDRLVRSCLFLTCYDYGKLLHHPSPEGHSFTLHLEGGLSMEFTVGEVMLEKGNARRYNATGTITDYVAEPGPLEIRLDQKGFMEITIRTFDLPPWKRIIMAEPGVIPHAKWADFEVARLARCLRIDAEYKILRLPYMLGSDSGAPLPRSRGSMTHRQEGKIIYLFNGEGRE